MEHGPTDENIIADGLSRCRFMKSESENSDRVFNDIWIPLPLRICLAHTKSMETSQLTFPLPPPHKHTSQCSITHSTNGKVFIEKTTGEYKIPSRMY